MATITLKRGDTLKWTCTTDQAITGWSILSQIRDANGKLITGLTVTVNQASPTGIFTLTSPGSTSLFPVGSHNCDIQYTTADGTIVSTDTFSVEILRDISHP